MGVEVEKLIYSNLQDMMEDFYILTHIRISFWDSTGRKCFMAPEEGNCAFCSELRKIPAIDQLCSSRDEAALLNARNSEDRLYRFQCAAGLNEYVYPVHYRDRLLGYFMYGQVRLVTDDETTDARRQELCQTNGLDVEHMQSLYEELPVTTEEAMLSAGRMMANLARHSYLNGILADYDTPFPVRMRLYLENGFMNPITVDSACTFFNVSRSHLCRAIQKEMHTTFSKLLNQRRIENVCKCLRKGQSIREAAVGSGFQSDNYMIRVFKSIMDCTPMQYVAQCRRDGNMLEEDE